MFGENIEDRERVCIEKIFERGHLWRKYLREGVFGENIGERVCKEKRWLYGANMRLGVGMEKSS